MSLTESAALIDEGIIVFSNQDDNEFKGLIQAEEAARKLAALQHARADAIKEEMEAMLKNHVTVQEQVQVQNNEAISEELGEKKRHLAEMEEEKVKQEHQVKRQKVALEECQAEKERLMMEKESLEDRTERIMPSIRHDVKLYSYISGVRWQHDSEAHEVKGYVSNMKSTVKTFALDTKKNSKFFIANYLWDLMEPDW